MNLFAIILLFLLFVQIIQTSNNNFKGYLFAIITSLLLIPRGIYVLSTSLKYNYLSGLLFLLFINRKKVSFPKSIGSVFAGFILFCLFIIIGGRIDYSLQLFYLFKSWLPIVMFTFATFAVFVNGNIIVEFNKILCLTTIVLCLYGLFEYVAQINPYITFIGRYYNDLDTQESALSESRGMITGRISCTTNHFLTWGQTLLLTLGYLFLMRSKIKKNLFLITVFLVIVNIIFTGSRSSVVPMLILLLGFIIRKTKYCIASLLFLFVLTNIPFSQKVQDTVDSFVFFWSEKKSHQDEMGGSSMELRALQLETSLAVASRNSLWFGQGLGYMESPEYAIVQRIMIGAECLIFPIIMQQGILGVIAWLLLYISLFVLIEKEYKKTYGVYSLYIGVFFFGYFTSLIMTGDRQTFVWFMVLYAIYYRSLQFIRR